MVMECIRYQRASAWSLTGDSRALKAVGGGRVAPTSEGAHLVMRIDLEPHGPLKLATPLRRRRMKSIGRRELAVRQWLGEQVVDKGPVLGHQPAAE